MDHTNEQNPMHEVITKTGTKRSTGELIRDRADAAIALMRVRNNPELREFLDKERTRIEALQENQKDEKLRQRDQAFTRLLRDDPYQDLDELRADLDSISGFITFRRRQINANRINQPLIPGKEQDRITALDQLRTFQELLPPKNKNADSSAPVTLESIAKGSPPETPLTKEVSTGKLEEMPTDLKSIANLKNPEDNQEISPFWGDPEIILPITDPQGSPTREVIQPLSDATDNNIINTDDQGELYSDKIPAHIIGVTDQGTTMLDPEEFRKNRKNIYDKSVRDSGELQKISFPTTGPLGRTQQPIIPSGTLKTQPLNYQYDEHGQPIPQEQASSTTRKLPRTPLTQQLEFTQDELEQHQPIGSQTQKLTPLPESYQTTPQPQNTNSIVFPTDYTTEPLPLDQQPIRETQRLQQPESITIPLSVTPQKSPTDVYIEMTEALQGYETSFAKNQTPELRMKIAETRAAIAQALIREAYTEGKAQYKPGHPFYAADKERAERNAYTLYQKALSICEQGLIEMHQQYPPLHFFKGLVLLQLDKGRQAEMAFTKAISMEAKPEYYVARANSRLRLGKHEHSLEDLDRAIELDPTNPSNYESQATILARFWRYEEAVLKLNQAINFDPNNIHYLAKKRDLLSKLGYHISAHEAITKIQRIEAGERFFADPNFDLLQESRIGEFLEPYEFATAIDLLPIIAPRQQQEAQPVAGREKVRLRRDAYSVQKIYLDTRSLIQREENRRHAPIDIQEQLFIAAFAVKRAGGNLNKQNEHLCRVLEEMKIPGLKIKHRQGIALASWISGNTEPYSIIPIELNGEKHTISMADFKNPQKDFYDESLYQKFTGFPEVDAPSSRLAVAKKDIEPVLSTMKKLFADMKRVIPEILWDARFSQYLLRNGRPEYLDIYTMPPQLAQIARAYAASEKTQYNYYASRGRPPLRTEQKNALYEASLGQQEDSRLGTFRGKARLPLHEVERQLEAAKKGNLSPITQPLGRVQYPISEPLKNGYTQQDPNTEVPLVVDDPFYTEAHYITSHELTGKAGEAYNRLLKEASTSEHGYLVPLVAARRLIEIPEFVDEALDRITNLIEILDNDPTLHYEQKNYILYLMLDTRGKMFMKAGMYPDAIENLEEIVQMDPKNNLELDNLARAQFKNHQFDKALETFKKSETNILEKEGTKFLNYGNMKDNPEYASFQELTKLTDAYVRYINIYLNEQNPTQKAQLLLKIKEFYGFSSEDERFNQAFIRNAQLYEEAKNIFIHITVTIEYMKKRLVLKEESETIRNLEPQAA